MRIIQKVAQVMQHKISVAERVISQSFSYFVSEGVRKGLIKDHEDIEKTTAGQRKNAITDVNVT